MQRIYRRIPMPKCDFNKVAKQLYLNRTSEWMCSTVNLLHIFRISFPRNTSWWLLLIFGQFLMRDFESRQQTEKNKKKLGTLKMNIYCLNHWLDILSFSQIFKKETLAQVFSCEFSEISKNTFFHRTHLVAASVTQKFL